MNVKQLRFHVPEMEGALARWYARNRGSAPQLAQYRASAEQLAAELPEGADILELAPGPGYHAIELARSGRFHVTGLDISHTMVDIARENAERDGIDVRFQLGDASDLPFDAGSFDLIVCQAAFNNYTRPGLAIAEMHRVLRVGGTAVIQDLRKDVTSADIDREVAGMGQNAVNAAMTKLALSGLRRRAYTAAAFEQLVADSPFRTADIRVDGIGMDIRLLKRSEGETG
jgi:ubiquinone/menaquinone biosynthesis C-methylase UbiE